MKRSDSVSHEKAFVVIGLSSGVCPQVCCFREWKEALGHSKKLAEEMDFRKEDYCPRTGGWHSDENDICPDGHPSGWIEEAELR